MTATTTKPQYRAGVVDARLGSICAIANPGAWPVMSHFGVTPDHKLGPRRLSVTPP